VIPADGAVVPRNTKIWILGLGGGELIDESTLQPVPTTATTIAIPPFSSLTKLTPNALLAPGRYSVPGSKFTVTDEIDTTPPAQPQVEVTAFGKVGAAVSRITVTGPSSPDTFLVIMGEPQTWEPGSVFAAGANGQVTALDFPAGPQNLKVVLVDAAGNASEPEEVTATIPKDRACSVAPVVPLSILALSFLRARRRRLASAS
jgi:hypothetical protein